LNIGSQTGPVESVCVYCGSSNTTDPEYLKAAAEFGRLLAASEVRMVYGGGGVGLMGACAKAAHNAGGKVLGVMPNFLRAKEILYDEVETIVVQNMHERKRIMFEESDAFVILPGGIGTLEEVVEILSWRRLALHNKPVVFYSPGGFWKPFFELIQHTVDKNLTPRTFPTSYRSVEHVGDILPAIAEMAGPPQSPKDEKAAVRLT
jgi:uncharacterized protein (TIGR00730 family)